jgi:hypothetical protein
MPCRYFEFNGGHGFLCGPSIYEFQGFLFEWHSYMGPCPLRRDNMNPRKTIPKGFWDMIEIWQKKLKCEKQKYLV